MTVSGASSKFEPARPASQADVWEPMFETVASANADYGVASLTSTAIEGAIAASGRVRLVNATTGVFVGADVAGPQSNVRLVIADVAAGDLLQVQAQPVENGPRVWVTGCAFVFTAYPVPANGSSSSVGGEGYGVDYGASYGL